MLYVLSFYNRPNSLISTPLVSSQVQSFVPQEKKSARCCRFESLRDSGFIAPNMAFYRLYKARTEISLAGPRSPGLLHYLHKVVGYLVPCPRFSFLVRDLRSSFRIPVPCSRSSLLVPDLTYRFITISRLLAKMVVMQKLVISDHLLKTFRIFYFVCTSILSVSNTQSGSSLLAPLLTTLCFSVHSVCQLYSLDASDISLSIFVGFSCDVGTRFCM